MCLLSAYANKILIDMIVGDLFKVKICLVNANIYHSILNVIKILQRGLIFVDKDLPLKCNCEVLSEKPVTRHPFGGIIVTTFDNRCALMCHAPIVLPEIAADRLPMVKNSTHAMEKAAEYLLEGQPDTIVVISPHTPRLPLGFSLLAGEQLTGDFSKFGFPQISMRFQGCQGSRDKLVRIAAGFRISLQAIEVSDGIDHGALVPLYFVHQQGWQGVTIVIGLPYQPSYEECLKLGQTLKEYADQNGKKLALLASGDMSHKLIEGAPAGFHPRAVEFDQWVTEHLKKGELQRAIEVDEKLRNLAAEDVIDSLVVARGFLGKEQLIPGVLSYEGPFGVGYLISYLR